MPGSAPGAARLAFHEWDGFDFEASGEGITSCFAAAVRAAGPAVAAVEGSACLTYDELDRRSNQLARYMLRRGAKPASLIGLHAGRSLASLIAIVATLKIRAGYVPLDPGSPCGYLDAIVHDCRPDLVLSANRDAGALSAPTITLSDALDLSHAETDLTLEEEARPDDIAYVMYTSGSTGRPKGVRVPHRAVVRLVTGQSYAHFGADEVLLHNAPLSFDASTFEIWGTLLHGARAVLVTDDHPSLKFIADTIRREGVTTAWFTAGLFRALVDQELEALSGLRQLLAGGDVLSPSHVMRAAAALPGCQLINGYGPTENTTFTCCYRVPREGWGGGPVPIGVPIGGTYVRLLDDDMRPVRDGEIGMLYAGGLGLAVDYAGDPVRSAEQFVSDPQRPDRKLYRTGDLVRRRPDGNLDFIGRLDRQVKVDGKRVEPGEIEEAIRRCAGISDAVVTATKGEGGALVLTAHVKPSIAGQGPLAVSAVHAQAMHELPPHMRPSRIVAHDEFPLTANGKIDQRLLTARATVESAPVVSAASETEHMLSRIFARVLGVRTIGVATNFFELGATSLKLMEAHAEISRMWPQVEVLALFRHPTIRDLARAIDGSQASIVHEAQRRARGQAAALQRLHNARPR
ncbi:MAG: non-ribosomal peptide synthetase [Rhodospirillales bacterium]|nr:non-ribosomal peptide synthetase [Rhodospirillales bacterium]